MSEHDLYVWAAAYYDYLGWTRETISHKLGRNKGTVARLIAEARTKEKGCLETVTVFNASDAPWDELQRMLLPTTAGQHLTLKEILRNNNLRKHLSTHSLIDIIQAQMKVASNLRQVVVCASGCKPEEFKNEDSHRWTERKQLFGRAAALHVRSLLEHSDIVGVTWGSTLGSVVDELLLQRDAIPRRRRPLSVVATVGEAIGDGEEADDISASRNARRLKEAIGGRRDKVYQLRGIPAVLPFSFKDKAAVDTAQAGLLGYPNYKEIFGKGGLVSKLDTVLTSVGNVNQKNKFFPRELKNGGYSDGDVAKLRWYGDIGGALFPLSDSIPPDAQSVARQVESRWTGMQLAVYHNLATKYGAKYEECGGRARIDQRPRGVVVLALGNNKQDVVWQALKEDIVNVLIIDDDLALGMLRNQQPR